MNTYRANGKLLLTGEYLVLKGALALALPTKLGQSMTVCPCDSIQWTANKPSEPWFSATLSKDLEVIATDDPSKAAKLAEILKAVQKLNPSAFNQGLCFETHLDFDPEWGLGSSSTMISNLAQWAEVDPYELLKMTFGGSGYDIACSTANSPVFYHLEGEKPVVQPADFNPPFASQLFFIYQGKKQQSGKEVKSFNQRMQEYDYLDDVDAVSAIGEALPNITTFNDFRRFIDVHEDILVHCLDREPVKTLYPDFEGSLKSLGAWGGDFILAATEWTHEQVTEYFKHKGLDTVFNYHDIIL